MSVTPDALEQHFQTVHTWTEKLHRSLESISTESSESSDLVADCLEELQVALEELQVAEEELCSQNVALLESQQIIEQERQRYQELFEFAPDGYLVTDKFGTVQEVNRAAASLLNLAQKHLIGKPLVSFVPSERRANFRALLNQFTRLDRVQEWELTLQPRQTDVPVIAALTVEAVRETGGQLVALRWLLRDITIRKRLETQLREMQLQNLRLIELDRLKNQFIATITHELRTPMNAILGFSELLLRQFHQRCDPQQVNMIERISRNGQHLLSLIESLLDFSQLEATRLQLQLEPFDLMDLVNTTAEELRSLAEQKGLSLTMNFTPSSLMVINDRDRLRQILVNLISNAIKFTDLGSVTIDVRELPEGRIVISVTDTGIGIAPPDQAQVFQAFWQVSQNHNRRYGGTGLGLSIAKALVELMQGSIAIESQLGQGSTFRIELPQQVGY